MGKEKNLKYNASRFISAAVIAGASFLPFTKTVEAIPYIELVQQPPVELIPPGYHPTQKSWIGDATFYSEAGCIGCNPKRIMANGERFNENALTIAFMRAPLDSMVLITNTENGESCVAKVTDQGNFDTPEYNKIGDLSKKVKEVIKGNDITHVKITLLERVPRSTLRIILAE
ncbi:MAG: hypothetical protein PHQ59_00620 [Candidatus Daviesbacteria bacterium]|nr:hypothetical protein [Candidatus Daviesbacteria bacterium]